MRLRVAPQLAWLGLGSVLMLALGPSGSGWADDVYLKEGGRPISGRVINEKEDAFVIEIPKDQIRRIERDAPTPQAQEGDRARVLWQETDDTVVLRLPRSLLRVVEQPQPDASESVSEPEPQPMINISSGMWPQSPTASKAEHRLGSVVGRVLWNGDPASGCRVKVVQVSRLDFRLAARLLGGSETEVSESAVREAITDAEGYYRFDRLVPGEYDIYWRPEGTWHWLRRLSDRPDLLVLAGEQITYPSLEANVRTIN